MVCMFFMIFYDFLWFFDVFFIFSIFLWFFMICHAEKNHKKKSWKNHKFNFNHKKSLKIIKEK